MVAKEATTAKPPVKERLAALLDELPADALTEVATFLEFQRYKLSIGDQSDDLFSAAGKAIDGPLAEIAQSDERTTDQIGKLGRRRGVMGGATVIAGTRIPPSAIWSFHEAGYDADAIIEQYPSLKPEDIEAAIAYERKRRRTPRRTHDAA